MKTDELITILSQDSVSGKLRMPIGSLSALLVLLCLMTTKFWLGLRPELDAWTPPVSFWFKTSVLGAMVLLSLHALKTSSVPTGKSRLRFLKLGLASFVLAALAYEWRVTPVEQIAGLFFLPNFKACLIYSTLFGSGASLALLASVKKYAAPLDLGRTAGLIGLAAACIGGLGYSVHCPIDSPSFIVVAYGIPQLTLYTLARFLFARALRW